MFSGFLGTISAVNIQFLKCKWIYLKNIEYQWKYYLLPREEGLSDLFVLLVIFEFDFRL